jgi:hypothetical protein
MALGGRDAGSQSLRVGSWNAALAAKRRKANLHS